MKKNTYWLGRKMSKETREKMSLAKKKNPVRYWKGKKREAMTGELHHMWKGGVVVDKDGYIWIMRHGHPNSHKSGYILEHRYIMAQTLGRALCKNEVVHHIDGNRKNNHIENLEIHTISTHMKLHNEERLRDRFGKFILSNETLSKLDK